VISTEPRTPIDKLFSRRRRVSGDLERFKDLIESRGSASGAWRGDVSNDATGAPSERS
jgi:hypothetical protein